MIFWDTVYAMGTTGSEGGGQGFVALIPLILIFVIFYFLLIRPQQKRAKQHQEFINSLRKGDSVITAGGLVGKVLEIDGDEVVLDLGNNLKVRILKNSIAGPRKR